MRARPLLVCAAVAAVCWLGLAPSPAQAEDPSVEASLSADTVAKGETVSLRIRLRGDAAASEPDLSPLEHDFEVLDVQRSQRTVIVNGVRDASRDWIVELLPRREGELSIPALAVGDLSTQPARLQVSASRADAEPSLADETPAAPVLLEVRADRSEPYQHERVLLHVQLLASGDVTEGALGAPEVPGTVVEPIGGDRRIEKEVGGKHYRGIERSYAFLPEASGSLVIPPVRFEGRMRMPRPAPRAQRPNGFFGGSFFEDFFSGSLLDDDRLAGFLGVGSRRVAIESEPVALRVRPQPEAAAGQWWLPAREVALSEHWDPAAGPVRVGEPLTRRIELRADGVSPAQLPALPAAEVEGVKQYAEAPKTTESERGTLRVGETTLIPTRAGAITLPAVEVAWWDTQADAPRTATLPARSLEVLPAAAGGETPAGAAATRAATAAPSREAAPRADAPAPSRGAWLPDARLLAALLAAALGAGGLLGVGIARRWGRSTGADPAPPLTRRAAERALRRACRRDQPAAAEAALRALGRALAPDGEAPSGTRWAVALGAPDLAREIARLQALRYLTEGERWNGAALWKAWRGARRTRRPPKPPRALPPLYPEQGSIRG